MWFIAVIYAFLVVSTKATAVSEFITTIDTRDYELKSITVYPKENPAAIAQKAQVEMVATDDAEFPFFPNDGDLIKGSSFGDRANYELNYKFVVVSLTVHYKSQSKSSRFFTVVNITNPGLNQNGKTVLNMPNCQYKVWKISDGSKVRYEVVDECGQWPGPGYNTTVYCEATVKTPQYETSLYSMNDNYNRNRWEKHFGKYEGVPSIQNPNATPVFFDLAKMRQDGTTLTKLELFVNVEPKNRGTTIFNPIIYGRILVGQ